MTNKTNREILLEGTMDMEQFHSDGSKKDTTLLIHLSEYPHCVDDALSRYSNKEDVITQLIDNISDDFGECVVSYSIEEDALSF